MAVNAVLPLSGCGGGQVSDEEPPVIAEEPPTVPDRGCVKTRLRSNFRGIKAPPDPEIIAYSAFYEVVVPETVFRTEFLHSLDPKRTFRIMASRIHEIRGSVKFGELVELA